MHFVPKISHKPYAMCLMFGNKFVMFSGLEIQSSFYVDNKFYWPEKLTKNKNDQSALFFLASVTDKQQAGVTSSV
jgi:hypothetical protein